MSALGVSFFFLIIIVTLKLCTRYVVYAVRLQDETLGERLWALTEMFPESVRNGTSKMIKTTGSAILGK